MDNKANITSWHTEGCARTWSLVHIDKLGQHFLLLVEAHQLLIFTDCLPSVP